MHVYVDVYAKCLCVKMMCRCDMWNERIILNNCWEWWDGVDYILFIFI